MLLADRYLDAEWHSRVTVVLPVTFSPGEHAPSTLKSQSCVSIQHARTKNFPAFLYTDVV